MNHLKEQLLQWIDDDRDKLLEFFSRFIQAKSPNPPGDTREAVNFISQFLDAHKLPYQIVAPKDIFPNIIGKFDCGEPGYHLVLNGHIDVFPVGDEKYWTYDPWGGTIAEGRIYGRGANDMKCGTTVSIFTFAYLHRIRKQLKGKLTLTCVSDEETFGPWGARYLMEHHPEVHGDCCLNGEPGSPYAVRFGEKGVLWIEFTIRTPGAHGAYTHLSPSATKIAGRLIADLETLTEIVVPVPEKIATILKKSAKTNDLVYGAGASKIIDKVTINIGTICGGLKVNMIPGECIFEADIRLPIGMDRERVLAKVEKIVTRYSEVSYRELNYTVPSSCPPDSEMVSFLQANAKQITGIKPEPIISLGGTDSRLWRYQNIPAYVYGPFPHNMGAANEYVPVEDFLNTLKVHILSAFDYLNQ